MGGDQDIVYSRPLIRPMTLEGQTFRSVRDSCSDRALALPLRVRAYHLTARDMLCRKHRPKSLGDIAAELRPCRKRGRPKGFAPSLRSGQALRAQARRVCSYRIPVPGKHFDRARRGGSRTAPTNNAGTGPQPCPVRDGGLPADGLTDERMVFIR